MFVELCHDDELVTWFSAVARRDHSMHDMIMIKYGFAGLSIQTIFGPSGCGARRLGLPFRQCLSFLKKSLRVPSAFFARCSGLEQVTVKSYAAYDDISGCVYLALVVSVGRTVRMPSSDQKRRRIRLRRPYVSSRHLCEIKRVDQAGGACVGVAL